MSPRPGGWYSTTGAQVRHLAVELHRLGVLP